MRSEFPEHLRAPEAPRRFLLHPYQWVGIPLMFLVPVLALFGTFGETEHRAEAASESFGVEVRYADRLRHKQLNVVEVWIENRSGTPLDTVVASFDAPYVTPFSVLSFAPSAVRPFEVELLGVAPGERRLVRVELQAEHYGRHEGALRVHGAGRVDTAAVALSTVVFP